MSRKAQEKLYCKAQARKVSLVLVMNGCEAIETCKLSVGVKACIPSTQPLAHTNAGSKAADPR